jgi:hypothetical protein
MEQRRLRLGDTLDDYCPRERRVTNHAVVAMIEEDIKQTRCTTCDAEHAYKGGKAPRRRKKETPAALYRDVLAGMPDAEAAPVLASAASNGHVVAPPAVAEIHLVSEEPVAEAMNDMNASTEVDTPSSVHEASAADGAAADDPIAEPVEDGPVHRPLIRATLPRPEGQKDTRQIPDFTIRQPGGRGGSFRGGDQRMKVRPGHGGGGGNGNRAHGGSRFGSARPAGPGRGSGGHGGPSAGFRGGQGQPRQGGGGRKRSR